MSEGVARTVGQFLDAVFSEQQPARVVVHGIAVPMDAPVQWLCEHLSHPDGFVHMVVTKQ